MKLSKRLISALLLVAFMVINLTVLPAFAAEFTDLTSSSKIYEAVSVLSNLGVINGYEDGSFKPDNNVTRAEFTAMLLRTRGLGSLGSMELENPPFPDVSTSDVSWAIGNIRTARELGIINGYEDGTFKPNNNVLYEEAVKMIVCSLGYENYSPEGVEWYSKYITTANVLKFLSGAGGAVGVPATRATIASMLYNCLEVNLAENNETTKSTILENDLKLTKKVGVIASNGVTSLSSPDVNLRDNEIQIEAPNDAGTADEVLTYRVSNAAEYRDMLGTQITFYYNGSTTEKIKDITLATVRNSASTTVAAKDIEPSECTSTTIAYYEKESSSSARRLSIAADSAVIYNDKLYGSNAAESTYAQYWGENGRAGLPTIGSVRLLDTEGDGTYDIIFIDKYDAYVASSVTSSSYTIVDDVLRKNYDVANKGNQLVLDPNDNSMDIEFVDENGKETSFSAIRKGSVVCVRKSNPANGGRLTVKAVVCNKSVSGTVKGISAGKNVTIDSTKYNYSSQAPWVNPIPDAETVLGEPKMADSGKYYFDMDGNIIAYDKNETSSNQQYGYIMNTIYNEDLMNGDTLVLHILNASGTKKKYSAYSKTKINGQTLDNVKAMNDVLVGKTSENALLSGYLYNTGSYTVTNNTKGQQVIKFSTTTYKGEEVIDEIVTVKSETMVANGADVANDKLTFYTPVSADSVNGNKLTYYSSNKQLKGSSAGQTINIKSSVVFNVPADRLDTDKYSKTTASGLTNETGYWVVCYDVTAAGSAGAVVVYRGIADVTEVKATSPVMVVTSVGKETNENEGESMYKLEGYVGATKVSYWGSPESEAEFAALNEGDVIRLGKDTDGYYTLKPEHKVFSVAEEDFRDGVMVYDYDKEDTVKNKDGKYVDSRHDTSPSAYAKEDYPSPAYRAIWGSAYTKDDDYLNVSTKLLTGADGEDTTQLYSIERSKFANAKIYIYDLASGSLDMERESVYVPTADNESIIDTLDMYNAGMRSSELFIHMAGGNVKTMIIVKR